MSKDFTVYVVDLSPYMGRKMGKSETALDVGLKAVYDNLNGRMIKFRASDRIAFVLCHSPVTENDHASEDSLRNIEVIGANGAFTYSDYEAVHSKLAVNKEERVESEGSLGEAVVVAIGLFKATEKLKFNRNLVVITSSDAILDVDPQLIEASSNATSKLNISLVINMVDFKDSNSEEWLDYASKLGGQVVDAIDANSRIRTSPLLKKIKPIAIYQGPLTFGADTNALDLIHDPHNDEFTLSFDVCLYPATKTESMPSLTLYYVDKESGSIEKVKYQTSYHIRKYHEKQEAEANEDEDVPQELEEDDEYGGRSFETVPIAKGDWEGGFKYSSYDFIAITKPLLESATYSTMPGISICSFIEQTKVPIGMLTEESNYVIPSRPSKVFCSLVEALLQEKKVALAQFVPKPDKEKQLTVLLPVKLQTGSASTVYGFIQIRLPFKEDAKMGHFPSLTSANRTLGGSDDDENQMAKFLPNELELELMEKFILSKDLDTTENKVTTNVVENSKLELKETEFFPFPQENDGNHKTFLQSSPAIAKYTQCLKRVIEKSLNQEYGDIAKEKDFISKYLLVKSTDKNATNLYTINTILQACSLNLKHFDSKKLEAELMAELDVQYVKKLTPEGRKKQRAENAVGTFYNRGMQQRLDEGNFEEILDLEDLLR